MKKLVFPFLFLFTIACNQPGTGYRTDHRVFDEETEKLAIMKIIRDETDCLYKRDYNGWKENFVQEEYAFQAWTNSDGSFDAKTGWGEISRKTLDFINANPLEPGKSLHPWIERRNLVVKFFSDKVAYLSWDQYNSDIDSRVFIYSKDQRIVEKVQGKWKIANVSSYWDFQHPLPVDSVLNL